MNEPVIEAVRVPPSAWITSQSIQIERSPSCVMSVTARKDRPTSRCISKVLPPCLPLTASLGDRFGVARGNIEYSAVTHPVPFPFKKGGTFSSTEAVQITLVSPISIKTDP